MNNIQAVFTKQLQSFYKNSAMFGTPAAFLLIPFLILVLAPGEIESNLIVGQFVVMFVGISMVGSAAGYIAEDRLTMNLRFMGMAGVKPYQYLVGTGCTMLLVSIIALILFGLMGQNTGEAMVNFLTITMMGSINSMLLGITLGLSKIASFTSLAGLLLGVGPMFAEANETLGNIFYYTYTMQVNNVIRQGNLTGDLTNVFRIMLINMVVFIVAFVVMNSKYGLDGEKL